MIFVIFLFKVVFNIKKRQKPHHVRDFVSVAPEFCVIPVSSDSKDCACPVLSIDQNRRFLVAVGPCVFLHCPIYVTHDLTRLTSR